MIRVLHAADAHLDSPFEGLSAELAARRRSEQRDLLRRIAELAGEKGAQLVLLAGDLFDSDGSYPETEESLRRALAEISVPVFISPGNHDFYAARSRYARMALPENVHVFKEPRIECVELPALGVRVWGAGFRDRECPPLLRGFTAPKQAGTTDIMCVHGEVGATASRYNPISEEDLAGSGMDYVALGHVHSFSGLRRAMNCFYAWPGCTEGRGFDETGSKGVILADIEPGNVHIEFLPLGGRRYEILELDAGAENLEAAALAALPEGSERDTYRIILTGECAGAPDIAALGRALEDRVFGLQIRDRTTLRRNVWERAGEDSLRGVFLQKLRARYDAAASGDERELITRAARYGLAALDGGEEAGA